MTLYLDGTLGFLGPNTPQGGINPSIAVATISDLKTLTIRPATVSVQGRTSLNDGGSGLFVWIAGDSTIADDSMTVQCTSGPGGRYKRLFNGVIYSEWFGAIGDGITDDAIAIQSAINFLSSRNGGTLQLLPKTYLINSQLNISSKNITIKGMDTTTINASFGNNSIIKFYNASSFSGGGVENLVIGYTGGPSATSGYAVEINNVSDIYLRRITWVRTYNGVGFIGANYNSRVEYSGGRDVVRSEIHVNGGWNQMLLEIASFMTITSTNQSTILIEESGRLDIIYGTSSFHKIGLNFKPLAGKVIQNTWITMPDMDASTTGGTSGSAVLIDVSASNSVVRNINIKGGSFGASDEYGLYVKSGLGKVGHIWIDGTMISNNLKEGVILETGRVFFNGVFVLRNGISTGSSGIKISGDTKFHMTGGSIGDMLGGTSLTTPMNYENFQLYGLEIASGFTGTIHLSSVDLTGNITGPVLNSSGIIPKITGCNGYKNIAEGIAVIANGTGFITVTPGGLAESITSTTPIFLTPLGNPDLVGIETIFRGATTSTTFDIATSPFLNVTNNLPVAWRIAFPSSLL